VGAPAPPGEEKNRRNLEGKYVSAPQAHQVHPMAAQETIFGTFFLLCGGYLEVGVVNLVVLDSLLKTTTKKVVNFLKEKSRLHSRQNSMLLITNLLF